MNVPSWSKLYKQCNSQSHGPISLPMKTWLYWLNEKSKFQISKGVKMELIRCLCIRGYICIYCEMHVQPKGHHYIYIYEINQ